MTPIFTKQDFHHPTSTLLTPYQAASLAQSKFEEWLKRQRIIFGRETVKGSALDLETASYLFEKHTTHRGYLILIEEINQK